MKRKIAALIYIGLLAACTGDGQSNSPEAKPQSPAAPAITINEDEIRAKTYTLKSDLSFVQADADRYKEMAGTSMEYEAVTYYYAFHNQRRLAKTEIASVPSFCSVYVEAHASTPPDAEIFKARGKLLKGQMMVTSSNESVVFALQLQAGSFKSFFLKCKNVADSAGAQAHIGHLLDIK